MNKLKKSSLKIQLTKINILVLVVLFLIIGVYITINVSNWKLKSIKDDIYIDLVSKSTEVSKNAEIINMVVQNVKSNQRLSKNLTNLDEDNFDNTLELLDFYQTEIKSLQQLINSNPLISHVRIYMDNDSIMEMIPVVYKKSRAAGCDWYDNDIKRDGYFDYNRKAENTSVYQNAEHLGGIITEISLDSGKEITLEVAADMNDICPGLYADTQGKLTVFINSQQMYYNQDTDIGLIDYNSILEYIDLNDDNYQCVTGKINGKSVIIAYKPLNGFDGILKLESTEDLKKDTYLMLLGLIFLLIIAFAFSVRIVDKLTVKALKGFYTITRHVKQIQDGDMDVVIPDLGNNELGEMSRQINIMLEKINILMHDNIQREVMVKDSQLKSLRNQINAHFLYNVLESIKMMAEIRKIYDVSDSVTALGNMLRYNLYWGEDTALIAEEIEYVKNYLSLVNLRYEHEIFLDLDLCEQILHARIPRMTFQPIIENSIEHGFDGIDEDTAICIRGYQTDNEIMIEISDTGKGMDDKKLESIKNRIYGDQFEVSKKKDENGIGIKNIHDRIQLMYGKNYGITVESQLNICTKITICVPLK